MHTLEKHRLDAILSLVALEKVAQVVVSHLAYEAGIHSEYGCSCDRVRRRSSCHKLHSHRFECLPDLVAGLHVHMLHAAARKMVLLQESVVREDCKYVGQRIADAKNRCHKVKVFDTTKQSY